MWLRANFMISNKIISILSNNFNNIINIMGAVLCCEARDMTNERENEQRKKRIGMIKAESNTPISSKPLKT